MFVTVFLICLLLGALVGFSAGLLGIGGGLIIVPVLLYLLPSLAISTELVMPMALATSLATIIITSSSAALAHHRNHNIPWHLAKPMMLVVGIGASTGAFIAELLTTEILTNFFSAAVIVLASYMLLSSKFTGNRELPNSFVLNFIAFITGIIASLMGIAGGAILVPVLTYFGMTLRHAIGLATVCGVAIATFGAVSFIYTGLQQVGLPAYSLGYIYLPALLGIIISSSFFAKLGVKMADQLPVSTLKRIFALFLMIVAIKMLVS